MTSAVNTLTRVLPGGMIQISDPDLQEGRTVRVIVVPQEENELNPAVLVNSPTVPEKQMGILDFLESLPKVERSEEYWKERDREFQQERDAWDR